MEKNLTEEHQLNKKIMIRFITLTVLFGALLIIAPVFAEGGGNEGGEGGGGDSLNGCKATDPNYPEWKLDTCTGAEWRYYETDKNEVVIPGLNSSYAQSETIRGCGEAGGYWRYAMIAGKDGKYANNAGTFKKGDQVGVIGMAGNDKDVFDSTYWGGGMNYYSGNTKRDEDFKKVGDAYKMAQDRWPNTFTKGFNGNSDLSWFCAENPNGAKYYSESMVSNLSTSNPGNNDRYESTGIRAPSDNDRTKDKTGSAKVGDVLYITFAHNVYADREVTKNVEWEVKRSVGIKNKATDSFSSYDTDGLYYKNYNNTRYTISTPEGGKNSNNKKYSWNGLGGSISGSAKIDKESGTTPGFMIDGGYGDSGRNSSYVARDYYRIKFVKAGIYKFCETISVNGTAITSACSTITVSNVKVTVDTECKPWVPDTYGLKSGDNWYLKLMSGTTSMESRARNATTYPNNWENIVYAKPGDKVEWIHCYYPGAQMVAKMDVTGLSISDPAGEDNHAAHTTGKVTRNTYEDFNKLWNRKKPSGTSSWTNKFNIKFGDGFGNHRLSGSINNNYLSDSSPYIVRKIKDTVYNTTNSSITGLHVGKEFKEWAETGFPVTAEVINRARHCNDGSCYHSNAYLYGNLTGNDGASSEAAKVLVPYNFNNIPTVNLGNARIYAGESVNVAASGTVMVGTRDNEKTKGTYSTKVEGAKVKMVGYLSGTDSSSSDIKISSRDDICSALDNPNGCTEIFKREGLILNSAGENNYEYKLSNIGGSAIINDVPAGTFYCVALAIYPASSGSDTMMEKSGSNTWAVSKPSCAKIAKKPSIQVWGAGLYTADKLSLSLAQKYNVAGQELEKNESIAFGSWVEQNVVALGKISGLASGAADGMPGSTNRTKGELGGSLNKKSEYVLCILNPLTMPNSNCNSSNNPGAANESIGNSLQVEDQESLIRAYNKDGEEGVYEFHELSAGEIAFRRNDEEYKVYGCEFESPSFDDVKTHVYTCEGGSMVINSDIEYADDSYTSFNKVPKIIIYAKEDVKISCSVKRVDAVLIAEDTVDDCYESFKAAWINDAQRSNQLTINGSIIADMMIARRTYGGATGENSSVPAEIVNYDTSLYLWSFSSSERSSSKNLKVDYQVELPPRL